MRPKGSEDAALNWLLWTVAAIAVLLVASSMLLARRRRSEEAKAAQIRHSIVRSINLGAVAHHGGNSKVDPTLPLTVARYFHHVLAPESSPIRIAYLRNQGHLRVATNSHRWFAFHGKQVVAPEARSFLWDARVSMPLRSHLRVLDSYRGGIGEGRVSMLSAIAIASEHGRPELNSGALHRYLAEAVWYPTALLPEAGVRWEELDERTAIARLRDHGTSVSLEFRFNAAGEVISIYTPGRWGRFEGRYRQVAWEGRFKNYEKRQGFRVPSYGEVGWYVDSIWQPVWKGALVAAKYAVSQASRSGN
jgi:hypothetical protein